MRGREKERESFRFRATAVTTTDLERSDRRSSTGSCNGRQGLKLCLASGDLWRQIIGDLLRFYTAISFSSLYWFIFLFVILTIDSPKKKKKNLNNGDKVGAVICKYLLSSSFFFFRIFYFLPCFEPQELSTIFKPRRFNCGSYSKLFFF